MTHVDRARPQPELICSRCVLRSWRRADRDGLVQVANNRNVWRHLADIFPHPYTEADADSWITICERLTEPTHWAIEVDGRVAGGIGIQRREGIYRRTAGIGYWLGEPFWGRGVMTEVVAAVSSFVLRRFELVRLDAGVFEWNTASMRVLEKCGYVSEGVRRRGAIKDGQVIDVVVYALVP